MSAKTMYIAIAAVTLFVTALITWAVIEGERAEARCKASGGHMECVSKGLMPIFTGKVVMFVPQEECICRPNF